MPVHSPLLKQSLLLAFPPLSDMLKFSGSLHVHQVTLQLEAFNPLFDWGTRSWDPCVGSSPTQSFGFWCIEAVQPFWLSLALADRENLFSHPRRAAMAGLWYGTRHAATATKRPSTTLSPGTASLPDRWDGFDLTIETGLVRVDWITLCPLGG